MRFCTPRFCLCSVVLALLPIGCSSKPSTAPPVLDGDHVAATDSGASTPDTAAKPPAKPAEALRLEPFDAPPLAELDAKAEWQERPIGDPLKMLREHQAQQKPLASVQEALGLKNTSKQANEKILSALGRLPASDGDVNFDAVVTRHTRADVKSTNPIMYSSTIEGEVNELTSLSLMAFDWRFNTFANGDVVKSWQRSKDWLVDKIVLRDDVTWSDGRPLTAQDVEFTFQTIMDPRVPVPAVRSGPEHLRWVKAYDDRTVVLFHKEALAINDESLAFPLIPQHVYEKSLAEDYTMTESKYHVKLEYEPVCLGPYVISSRERDQLIVCTRREDWYLHDGKQVREKPYFKEVRFKVIKDSNTSLFALQGGEVEDLELTAEQWVTLTQTDDFYKLNTKAMDVQWLYYYFGWNNDPVKAPFFTDKRVRQAMSYAFDHQEMLSKLHYGLYSASAGVFHPSGWMAPKDPAPPYTQNLDKAEALLKQAGWQDHDDDGVLDKQINGRTVKFEFTILCSEVPERKAMCDLLKSNLDQIGIICHVKPTEFTVLQKLTLDHDFQAHFGGWSTGTDPFSIVNIFGTGETRNFGQYSNAKVDALFEQGLKEFDREKRAAIYGRIHEILYEDQPYTWLYFRNSFYGFNKDLRGYTFSPRGPYSHGPGFLSLWKED